MILPPLTSRSLLLFLAFIMLGSSACDLGGPTETSDGPGAAPPRALTTQEEALVETGRSFGLKLFRRVSAADGAGKNVFISPLSVSMALGMTLNGAKGKTHAGMEEALELNGLSQEEINTSYQSLIALLKGLDPKVRFQIANSIWQKEGFPVAPSFVDTNREYFDAEVSVLDFDDPQTAETVNSWVADQTEDKIKKIIKPPIPGGMVMFLINAIYFKGDWRYQFDESKTQEAPFTLANGDEKSVPMMRLVDPPRLGYYQSEKLEAVDLPYGDSLYTMTVLVPRQGQSAQKLAEGLDAAQWQAITEGLRPTELSAVELPRFTLKYKKKLNDFLKAMGMEEAFDANQSNFKGINEEMGEKLFISDVVHKTFVKVDEEGTEAAAVTKTGMRVTSVPPAVRADRPFVVVIRENHSDTILFIGKVADPAAA